MGGAKKFVCVYKQIMWLAKIWIFNSRLLDPNQEHQALVQIINTPREGWIGIVLI